MTQQKKMQSNILTIVATAYQEKYYNMAFVDSMLNQTKQDGWEAKCIHNGKPEEISSYIKKAVTVDYSHVWFTWSDENTGNYGCKNRQWAIENCDTPYIIQSSIQDYWPPQAMEYIIKAIERYNPDLIIWDSINHLVGPCKVLESKLEWAKIDWGNFAIKTEIAKKVGINHGDQYCADWLFIQDVLNSGLVDEKKILKIPYILTIHNLMLLMLYIASINYIVW